MEIVPPGTEVKASAGAGQTLSRGSPALFYNPANIISCRPIQADVDFALAKIQYQYQHPDSEHPPAKIDLTLPPVTFGGCMRPLGSMAFGLAIMPTGIGTEQKIPVVPLELSRGTIVESEVTRTTTSMKIAAGGAYRFSPVLTAGFGLIVDHEDARIVVRRLDQDDPYVDAKYAGQAMQFVLGVRSYGLLMPKLALGASYKSAATKKHKGTLLISIDAETSEEQPFDGRGFSPSALAFGADMQIGNFTLFFDFTREMWSEGRSVQRSGLGNDGDSVDLLDTNNFALGGKMKLDKGTHILELSYGMVDTNVGLGSEVPEEGSNADDEESEDIKGVAFGAIDSIARTIIASGYRYRFKGLGYLMTGLSMHSGKKVVPEGFGQPGTYTMSILMGHVGLHYSF